MQREKDGEKIERVDNSFPDPSSEIKELTKMINSE